MTGGSARRTTNERPGNRHRQGNKRTPVQNATSNSAERKRQIPAKNGRGEPGRQGRNVQRDRFGEKRVRPTQSPLRTSRPITSVLCYKGLMTPAPPYSHRADLRSGIVPSQWLISRAWSQNEQKLRQGE